MKLTWKWCKEPNGEYLTIPSWQRAGVDFLFTGRNGGYSRGSFAGLNLGLHVGDVDEDVVANRRLALSWLGQSLSALTTAEQIHGAKVMVVGREDRGKGAWQQDTAVPETDALVTNQAGLCLTLFFADCIPLGFFDPMTGAIGLAHGGWKGTKAGIAVKTVETMRAAFGVQPQDIQVVIGPGIGACCFEIHADLAGKVAAEMPEAAAFIHREEDRWFWDLKATNRALLLQAGILPEHILDVGYCTVCESEHFYSYRKENGRTGRMAAIIEIRE